MDQTSTNKNESKYLMVIGILSVAIPVVVAILLFMPQTGKLGDFNVSFLPHLNAILNTATSFCLVGAFVAIKGKNEKLHKTLMLSAFAISAIFLVSYVIYHYQGAQTYYGDFNKDGVLTVEEKLEAGMMRTIYLVVLITHIILATVVVPFVLLSLYFALTKQFAKHKKVVKWGYPIWLYVAVTGVLVYLMISPFYT